MKTHVTVIPVDSLIIVDGQALRFEFAAPENLHALQWHNGKGHMEWLDDFNHPLSGEILYAEDVEPYVKLWEAEAARLEAEAKAFSQNYAHNATLTEITPSSVIKNNQ